jgi:small subunit ribosomal protein S9
VAETAEHAEVLEPVAQMRRSSEIVTVGRRKEASARVRMRPGTGKFVVNGRTIEEYLAREVLVRMVKAPFEATGNADQFDVRARCQGGGLTGQAGALRLGVSRALLKHNESLRKTLRQFGYLTRDARAVERKKYGQPGARKRFQFSKR